LSHVEEPFITIKVLAHVAGEVHHGAVLDGGDGNLLDAVDRQIEVAPVVPVVGVTVEIYFIYLVIWT
jgi:spermidine synthase